jgi:hypothetical protein
MAPLYAPALDIVTIVFKGEVLTDNVKILSIPVRGYM